MLIYYHTSTKSSAGCHSSQEFCLLGKNFGIESTQNTFSLAVTGILELVKGTGNQHSAKLKIQVSEAVELTSFC